MAISRERVAGRWVHAHEEDSEAEMVFRPAGTRLPPSRGRRALDLREDGSAIEEQPGPVDRPEQANARWELSDDGELAFESDSGSRWRAHVVAADPDRLVLNRREIEAG